MKNRIEFKGFWFSEDTNEQVKRIISTIGRDRRVRVWYGDIKTGKSWNEENDICGYIARSTGDKKIPLLVNNGRSYGGGGLLDDCIIKIVDTKTKQVLYKHPLFNQSVFMVDKVFNDMVLCDGETYANCKTPKQAIRLCDFMNGERMSK